MALFTVIRSLGEKTTGIVVFKLLLLHTAIIMNMFVSLMSGMHKNLSFCRSYIALCHKVNLSSVVISKHNKKMWLLLQHINISSIVSSCKMYSPILRHKINLIIVCEIIKCKFIPYSIEVKTFVRDNTCLKTTYCNYRLKFSLTAYPIPIAFSCCVVSMQ